MLSFWEGEIASSHRIFWKECERFLASLKLIFPPQHSSLRLSKLLKCLVKYLSAHSIYLRNHPKGSFGKPWLRMKRSYYRTFFPRAKSSLSSLKNQFKNQALSKAKEHIFKGWIQKKIGSIWILKMTKKAFLWHCARIFLTQLIKPKKGLSLDLNNSDLKKINSRLMKEEEISQVLFQADQIVLGVTIRIEYSCLNNLNKGKEAMLTTILKKERIRKWMNKRNG